MLIAAGTGRAAGFLVGYLTESSPTRQPVTYAVLRSLYVRAEDRRHGIAGALTDSFVSWARRRGAAEAHVSAYTANTAAQVFYENHGFGAHSLTRVHPL